ncbi:MAG TPA: hypothetical protein VIL26_06130 [Clostridia bacterium]
MKKILKNILIVFVIMILAATGFTGCSYNPSQDYVRLEPGTLPKKIEGKDYSPLARYDETVTVNVLGVNYDAEGDVAATYKGKPSGPKNQSFNDIALEVLNIKLNYVTVASTAYYETALNLMISSNTLPDIIVTSSATTYELLRSSGMLADLGDTFYYLNQDLQDMYLNDYYDGLQTCMVEGSLYALPNVSNTYESAQRIYLRKDWLDLVGKEAPTTVEELIEVGEAFRDNASKIAAASKGLTAEDIIPIGIHKDIEFVGSYGAQGLFELFGAGVGKYFANEDGTKLYDSNTSEEMKTALKVISEMYSKKLIDQEFFTKTSSDVAADIIAGKIGIMFGQWWVPEYPLRDSVVNPNTPNADWVAIDLVGYNNKPAYPIVNRVAVTNYNMVSKSFEHPEAIARLINLFFDMYYNENAVEIYGEGATAAGAFYHNWVPVKLWHSSASILEHKRVQKVFKDLYDAGYRIPTSDILQAGSNYDWNTLYTNLSKDQTYGPIFNQLKQREKTLHFKRSYPYYQALRNGKAVKDMNSVEKEGFGIYEEMIKENGGYSYVADLTEGKKQAKYNEFYGTATPTQQEKGEYINSYMKEFFLSVITGEKSISEWNTFVKQYNKNGGSKILEEVNSWYAQQPKLSD